MPPKRSAHDVSGRSENRAGKAAEKAAAARRQRAAAQQQPQQPEPLTPREPEPEPEPEPAAEAEAEDPEAAAAAAERKRLKNKQKREKAKAKKLAQVGGPTAEAQALLDAGAAADAFALLAPRQTDASPPKLLHKCALRWRDDCAAAVAAEIAKGSGGNLQVEPLPDPLAFYLRRTGEECLWRLPKGIHPLLASPLYCRFAFAEGDLAAEPSATADDIKCGAEVMKNAKGDMEALQTPNCAGVLVPTGRAPSSVAATILREGVADWSSYWRARATAVPRLPQLRRERGAVATLLPSASNQRLATNHLTLPLTILWAAREHGIDLQPFVGGKRTFRVHVVGAEEDTEGRNAEVLREIALLLPEIQCEVTLLGPGMADHAPGWITHEGLTVNGRKGLYHDLLPPATASTTADGTIAGGVATHTEAATRQTGKTKTKTIITTIMPKGGEEVGNLAAPDLALLINAGVYEYGSWFPSLAALAAHGFPATITTLSHLDHACSRSFLAALTRGEATLLPGAIDEKTTTEAERLEWSKKGNGSMWPRVSAQGRNPFGATHVSPLGQGAAFAARNLGYIHLAPPK